MAKQSKKPTVKPFCLLLLEARQDAQLTQLQLSQLSGLCHAAICSIEQGRRDPSLKSVRMISGAMGITVSQLLQE